MSRPCCSAWASTRTPTRRSVNHISTQVAAKLNAATATTATDCASRLPLAPEIVPLTSTPVSSEPTMPPMPCTPNTSSESSAPSQRLKPVAPQ